MDICSELSFPPFQLSLHLSHPEETSGNEFHLQMCAKLIHHLTTSRRRQQEMADYNDEKLSVEDRADRFGLIN